VTQNVPGGDRQISHPRCNKCGEVHFNAPNARTIVRDARPHLPHAA
jgi:hypothetical protein